MTRAPSNLLAVRSLLLTHLDNAPGPDDLDPAEAGIVGDPAHRGGYHCGSDRVDADDYSVDESPRDRAGLTDFASALDVGQFKVTTSKGTFDLPHYSRWLVAQCEANTADTRDIREVIYSPDGTTVKRWDRLGRRSSGDSSHRWHTHESFFRDAIKAGRDQTAVVRRYLTTIGLIKAPTVKDPDVAFDQEQENRAWATTKRAEALMAGTDAEFAIEGEKTPRREPNRVAQSLARIEAQLVTLSGRDFTDEPAIIQGVLAGLTPEAIAAAIPPTMAKQVADELARRLVTG